MPIRRIWQVENTETGEELVNSLDEQAAIDFAAAWGARYDGQIVVMCGLLVGGRVV